jgi:hypothetical protein
MIEKSLSQILAIGVQTLCQSVYLDQIPRNYAHNVVVNSYEAISETCSAH